MAIHFLELTIYLHDNYEASLGYYLEFRNEQNLNPLTPLRQ